jgi:hypothetical protein
VNSGSSPNDRLMIDVDRWPALPSAEWKDTLETLHLWTQIVGKIRLRQEWTVNHWWHVALYVSTRGLTTSMMPYSNGRSFSIEFDFVSHQLRVAGCDGELETFDLRPMSVAEFYRTLMGTLDRLDIRVRINMMPNEIPNAIRFDEDNVHASYDAAYVERFWRALLQADKLCKRFRSAFIGKVSPVHFFWGSFDLAVTRFSGRRAPVHPGGIPNLPDWVTREAYSHEVQSVGFWPGGYGADALFYSYAYPMPAGFSKARVEPSQARWSEQFKEFVLPYEDVRTSSDSDDAVMRFFTSTYQAAADLAKWDRDALERRDPVATPG